MQKNTLVSICIGLLFAMATAFLGYSYGRQNVSTGHEPETPFTKGDDHVMDVETAHTDSPEQVHSEHEGHEEGEASFLKLDKSQVTELGITTGTAAQGTLTREIALTGEVRLNEDRTAHVVPRLSGVVTDVFKSVAETVKAGEVLMVIESRELADSKATYLASLARLTLAEQILQREEGLWKKKISPEQDYLRAKQACAETRIEMRAAEQKLHALGVSEDALKGIPAQAESDLTRFAVTAPFEGTIIQKHVALGEFLEANADCYLLADLSTVWVDANVGKNDLITVKAGQKVTISAQNTTTPVEGTISFVAPIVGEQTRTAVARIVLPNPEGIWRPGLFVNITVAVGSQEVQILAPTKAIVKVNEASHVFVQEKDGFALRPVEPGASTSEQVEILKGLSSGETFVIEGAYTLKAELEKASMAEGGHNH